MLNENIFTSIAKLIARVSMKGVLPRIERELNNDPELKASMLSLKAISDKLELDLKVHCKRHPESKHCKDMGKPSKEASSNRK